MKNKWISGVATLFLGSSLFLASCGGNNGDMPQENTEGNNRETGVEGTGDLPGTGAEDTTGMGTDTTTTSAGGTTSGTTAGTTTGTTTGQ